MSHAHEDANKRIYLSPPHMSCGDRERLLAAFDSGWIAPAGPDVDAFEREFAAKVGVPHAVALASGTAALHLALLSLGIQRGDAVATSTLTFAASANAICHAGATPVFIDSERTTWNIDPELLSRELEASLARRRPIKAVLAVDVFGQCADHDALRKVCGFYEIPLIEDSAEALGATYRGRAAGTLGDIGCFSFNGNKIITTSSGGMLVTARGDWARLARHLATQAREPVPHYEHRQIGFNYRMSNLLAAVGRGQLEQLDDRVARKRAIHRVYVDSLGDLPGLDFMPEAEFGRASRWLTCVTIDSDKFGASREEVRQALEAAEIESRAVWKPMHLQPVYAGYPCRGGSVAQELFERGLCLPSGTAMSESQLGRVVSVIRSVARRADRNTVRGVSRSEGSIRT